MRKDLAQEVGLVAVAEVLDNIQPVLMGRLITPTVLLVAGAGADKELMALVAEGVLEE